MSVLMVQAWKCDSCGHFWLSKSKPKRCAKCKKVTWDSYQGNTFEAPARRDIPKVMVEVVTKMAESVNRSVAGLDWSPNSKCKHGYMNSFVCQKNGGGC